MPSTSEFYTLSLHDALPIWWIVLQPGTRWASKRWPVEAFAELVPLLASANRSEEHTSELQSLRHLVCRLPPSSTLFPYTTLFRSGGSFSSPAHAGRANAGRSKLLPSWCRCWPPRTDRKSTRLNSSHLGISYAVYLRVLHSFPTRRSSDLVDRSPARHTLGEQTLAGRSFCRAGAAAGLRERGIPVRHSRWRGEIGRAHV